MAGKFELYKDKAGEFRFRLKAGNGEIILASEGYKQKASAMNGTEGCPTWLDEGVAQLREGRDATSVSSA